MKRATILLTGLLLLAMAVALAPPALADFTNPPSFGVTTTNNLPGATDAVYNFTLGDLDDAGDFIKEVKIKIPFGYTGNVSLLTPGSLLGTFAVDGFTLEVRSLPPGNRAAVLWVWGPLEIPVGEVVLNWMTGELTLSVTLPYTKTLVEAVLTTVAGLFVNPQFPGTYTWRAWAKPRNSDFRELNPSDVVITNPALPTMHVERIDLSFSSMWGFTLIRGEVTIANASHTPLQRAWVNVQWSGPVMRPAGGTTNSAGKASFYLIAFRRSVTYTLTVLNVARQGFEYKPGNNHETSDDIFIP